MSKQMQAQHTSWQQVKDWYNHAVGKEGLYYHQQVVIPGVLRLLELKKEIPFSSILDVACGQGILARHLPEKICYTGIDISKGLIQEAKRLDQNKFHEYFVGDATQPYAVKKKDFSHATVLLALQNIEDPKRVFSNIANHLISQGILILVLNHPSFRIPRQSQWGIDEQNKLQYRKMNGYLSPLKIPMQMPPSNGETSEVTWSFHYPLSSYSKWLYDTGFDTVLIEEWTSDKVSTGKAAKMENRARKEFPLFLTLVARKRP